ESVRVGIEPCVGERLDGFIAAIDPDCDAPGVARPASRADRRYVEPGRHQPAEFAIEPVMLVDLGFWHGLGSPPGSIVPALVTPGKAGPERPRSGSRPHRALQQDRAYPWERRRPCSPWACGCVAATGDRCLRSREPDEDP